MKIIVIQENWAQQLTPVIPTTQEAEIKRIMVQGQLGQKVSESLISTK
jgi:hypothetical protein